MFSVQGKVCSVVFLTSPSTPLSPITTGPVRNWIRAGTVTYRLECFEPMCNDLIPSSIPCTMCTVLHSYLQPQECQEGGHLLLLPSSRVRQQGSI